MAFSVVMPALEMAQETGKLIAWRKREGDRVTKGEPLLEIETDKAVLEVEAPADGILAGISAQIGTDIPVGRTIAWIVAPGEKPPVATEPAVSAPAARAKTESRSAPVEAKTVSSTATQNVKISPKARRLAKELGVKIEILHGSGPGGEILASDVQAAASVALGDAPVEKESEKFEIPGTVGRLMAERTTQSWTTIPHFFVSRDIEATALNRYRAKLTSEIERAQNLRITHTDLLVALTARALLRHPRLNSSWTPQGIRFHDHVNIAVAVAVDDGVVAAVIPDAQTATITGIANQRQQLSERARAGKLRPTDIADATFTISNLGMHRIDAFSAIITPPQASVLAVGSISDRVIALDDTPVVRPMMTLTLSCDHRVVDGARAAIFLSDLKDAITEPEKWLA
jgi:pyruvate dehydrogenase E2 component (dihydrolipoamide acetyltransferase)